MPIIRCKSISTASIRANRGFTVTELALASAVMAIIMPALMLVFMSANRGFTGFEATASLKQANQNTVNRMYLRLGRCKRLFQNDTIGAAMLAHLDLTGAPSLMSGSQLPTVQQNGSLEPSSGTFSSASFGNRLLFAYNSNTQMIHYDAAVATTTFRIDLYKFAYYYLTPDNAPNIGVVHSYKTVEWQSKEYADCSQISSMSAGTKKVKVINTLITAGITHCLTTSATDYTVAFSSIGVTGTSGTVTAAPTHTVKKDKPQVLTALVTGLMGTSYSYGVAPNTAGLSNITKPVPKFATVTGAFPAGLEFGIVGPSTARKVLIRSVLYAQGPMAALIMDDQTLIAAARDIW